MKLKAAFARLHIVVYLNFLNLVYSEARYLTDFINKISMSKSGRRMVNIACARFIFIDTMN